jgi:hypothetical protein
MKQKPGEFLLNPTQKMFNNLQKEKDVFNIHLIIYYFVDSFQEI